MNTPSFFSLRSLNLQGYQFTEDWFTEHIPLWNSFFVGQLCGKPIKCMEIGCFEGLSTVWQLQNLCTHPHSLLHCVDPWDDVSVERRFRSNVRQSGFSDKVHIHKAKGIDVLCRAAAPFDFFYIDGDHQAKFVLLHMALCWRLLRYGGIVVVDDYLWQPLPPVQKRNIPPKKGVDAFLELWLGEYSLLHKGRQVILRKD